jgi:copper chaperone CopZ
LNPCTRLLNPVGMTLTLHVTGMTCGGCENAVKRAVGRLPGVAEVTASHQQQRVTVAYDAAQVTPGTIAEKITALGYRVAPGAQL